MTPAPAIGSVVGGCRIEALIGRGGMGVVYLAEQVALGRRVALKLLAPALSHDAEFRARFQQEARTAASLEHPNVVPIYEAGESDGQLYLVMRHVEGIDLRTLLRREGPLAPPRAARIVAQVAAALDAAHANGLVHRDIKPANILIRDGDDEHVYLSDFGLTKRIDATGGLTQTGQWLGTPDYVAPEQVEGRRLDARTDVYALGCVLYEALTGVAPYRHEAAVAKLWAHVNEPVPTVTAVDRAVPPAFDAVVARALAKDPGARYASAGGLGRAALAAAAEGHAMPEEDRSVATGEAAALPAAAASGPRPRTDTVRARTRAPAPAPRPTRARAESRSRRTPALLAAIAALLLAAGALGAALLASGSDDPRQTRSQPGARADAARRAERARSATTRTTPVAPAETSAPSSSSQPSAGTDDASGSASPDYVAYRTDTYALERPAGWVTEKDFVQENDIPRYRSQWSDATCGCQLIVDHIVGYGRSALQNAAGVPGGTVAPASVGAFDDVARRTAIAGSSHEATYFIAVGADNYAVKASAPSAATAETIASRVAGSLRPAG